MNKLKEIRLKKNFTRQHLANLTGLSKMTIYKIENGIIKNPSFFTLKKIAQALNVSVEELFDLSVAERR